MPSANKTNVSNLKKTRKEKKGIVEIGIAKF